MLYSLLNKKLWCIFYSKSWYFQIFRQNENQSDLQNFCTPYTSPVRENSRYFHTVYTLLKNEKFSLTKFFFSSNKLFSNLLSKSVTFTEFLAKMHERIPVCNFQKFCRIILIFILTEHFVKVKKLWDCKTVSDVLQNFHV